MKTSENTLRIQAFRYLSRRAHSRFELERKLLKRFPPQETRLVLDEFESSGYLDDQEFALERSRHLREHKLWGDLRIATDLQRHGISAKIISHVLSELDRANPQEDCLRAVVRSWLEASGEPRTAQEAMRLFKCCLARGFPRSLVRQALQPLLQALDWTA